MRICPSRRWLPEYHALYPILQELNSHLPSRGLGLDESGSPDLAAAHARRSLEAALRQMGADQRQRLEEQGRRDELDIDEWLRAITAQRHRMALLGEWAPQSAGADRLEFWQSVIAEAELRTGAGVEPAGWAGGDSGDLRKFESALRALKDSGVAVLGGASSNRRMYRARAMDRAGAPCSPCLRVLPTSSGS